MHAVVHHYEEGPQGVIVRYDREIEDRIQRVEDLLREKSPDLTNLRWHEMCIRDRYVGLKLFGLSGLILGPVGVLLIGDLVRMYEEQGS